MKKIGIATQYTNSCNYGGCLQSYALCKVLKEMGHEAQQIRFARKNSLLRNIPRLVKYHTACKKCKEQLTSIYNKLYGKISGEQIKINLLRESFSDFRNSIPHTDIVYNDDTIEKCNQFDCYITGSDQVWTIKSDTEILDKFYWLKFVNHKKKISYAASIGATKIPERLYSVIDDTLSDFSAISVRQRQDKILLDSFVKNKAIFWVLDPTLLLTYDDWKIQCSDNPYAKDNYIFAYILGSNTKDRELIMRIAHYLNLKVITIPYLLTEYRSCDAKFGDIKLSKVTPNYWLSLIKDAKYVFTDSFHCVALSLIFHTDFYALKRFSDNDKNSINSRIESLLSLVKCESRIISNSITNDEFKDLTSLDYSRIDSLIERERKMSMQYLSDALES